jgi:hypothetical protein
MRFTSPNPHAGLVAVLAVTVAAVQRPLLDDRSVATFLRELQRDLARDDRAAVSALVQYPLTVFAGGVRIPISDAAALRQNFDLVFSPALKDLISHASMPRRGAARSAGSVVVTDDFATIGVDAVRIEPAGEALKITRITVPLAAPSAGNGAGVTRRGGAGPQRLRLDFGRIQRAGVLAGGEREAYLLSARKNRLLEVRINGVSGRDIVARIINVTSGAAIDARSHEGVRTWIGRIPEDGDYRIEVVRLAPGGAPRLDYVMVVAIR